MEQQGSSCMMLECARTRTGATASIRSSQHASAPSTNASNLRALSPGQDPGRFKQKVGKQKVAGAASKQAPDLRIFRVRWKGPHGEIRMAGQKVLKTTTAAASNKKRTGPSWSIISMKKRAGDGRAGGLFFPPPPKLSPTGRNLLICLLSLVSWPLPSPYAGFGHYIPLSPLPVWLLRPLLSLARVGLILTFLVSDVVPFFWWCGMSHHQQHCQTFQTFFLGGSSCPSASLLVPSPLLQLGLGCQRWTPLAPSIFP